MIEHRVLLEKEINVADELLDFDGLTYANATFIDYLLLSLEISEDGKLSADEITMIYKMAVAKMSSAKAGEYFEKNDFV